MIRLGEVCALLQPLSEITVCVYVQGQTTIESVDPPGGSDSR